MIITYEDYIGTTIWEKVIWEGGYLKVPHPSFYSFQLRHAELSFLYELGKRLNLTKEELWAH